MPETTALKHLADLWDDQTVNRLGGNELSLLRYRSNLLGADLRITNFGGGNTSSKLDMTDPFTGAPVRVLVLAGYLRVRSTSYASLEQQCDDAEGSAQTEPEWCGQENRVDQRVVAGHVRTHDALSITEGARRRSKPKRQIAKSSRAIADRQSRNGRSFVNQSFINFFAGPSPRSSSTTTT